MLNHCLRVGLLCAIVGFQGVAVADRPPPANTPEIIGNIEEWSPVSGFVRIGGERYELAGDVAITTRTGEPVSLNSVEEGRGAGVHLVEGKVQSVILF